MSNGKGSKRRPEDTTKIEENWENIDWSKPEIPIKKDKKVKMNEY